MPPNGSRISGEPLLKRFDESTQSGARRHEPPYPEPAGRRIEGGEARDGFGRRLVRLHSLVMRRSFWSTYAMPQVSVRRMSAEQVAEVTGVWRRSRLDAAPEIEARLGHSLEDDLGHFGDVVMRECDVWIAELDGLIVGMMAIRGGHLEKLYVEPNRQRLGIGTLLLDKAKSESPSGLTLFTHQVNSRARGFYEARGFEPIEFGMSSMPENEPDVKYAWSPRRSENAA